MGRIAGRFSRFEPRLRAARLVLGLLSDLPRKNCWTIAEWAGEANPHGMQHLLCRASWDADAVREYVVEHLCDQEAVLVVDETGDVKKGVHTGGVQRQYTKPELARRMIERFLVAGHRVGWVAGDEVYGGNPKLRSALEERGLGYVLAVACSAEVTTNAGAFRADTLAAKVPKRAWQKLSAGAGAKGNRFYDWAVIDLAETGPGHRHLLIRRNRRTSELAYYRCHSTRPVPLTTLVRVAGSRWRVEETFQTEKGLAGLDEHQLRRCPSWARWVTLAMLVHAFLAVVRADEHTRLATDDLIPLTCNEIQHLFIALAVRPLSTAAHRLSWSEWRRRHQARSRTGHYRRQAANQT
ncbi:IS701 family transposase [Streptomyces sp. NPDC096013]|uniref:IS701 family transposase n=1 Tax=Streptomyces sp. NPDC096013 TaxID=3366069 RepID=UPI003814C876